MTDLLLGTLAVLLGITAMYLVIYTDFVDDPDDELARLEDLWRQS